MKIGQSWWRIWKMWEASWILPPCPKRGRGNSVWLFSWDTAGQISAVNDDPHSSHNLVQSSQKIGTRCPREEKQISKWDHLIEHRYPRKLPGWRRRWDPSLVWTLVNSTQMAGIIQLFFSPMHMRTWAMRVLSVKLAVWWQERNHV